MWRDVAAEGKKLTLYSLFEPYFSFVGMKERMRKINKNKELGLLLTWGSLMVPTKLQRAKLFTDWKQLENTASGCCVWSVPR